MKFRKKKSDKPNSRNSKGGQQRVYTYYTASREQINQFEKSNQARQSNETHSTLPHKLGYIFAAILFIVLLAFTLIISSEASIKIKGESTYNSDEFYRTTINEIINQDIQNKFKLTLNPQEIEQSIKDQIPEVDQVEVYTNPIGRGVYVEITTNEAFAVLNQNNSPSYIIDDKGKLVVDINNTKIDTSKLSSVINESGLEYNLSDQLFKPDEMQAIRDLQSQYTKGDNSKRVTYVLPQTPREINVTDAGFYIKYGLDDSTGADTIQQYGAMIAIKKQLAKQGSAPKEYIDARLGDKVFVR